MNIWEIRDQLGLKKFENEFCQEKYGYKGIVSTGDFKAMDDYGVGLLEIKICNPVNIKYPIITITTIDDGVWQAYGRKFVDIDELSKNFTKNFTKNFGVKLPTEEELNNFLNSYGIFGQYTG